MSTGLSDDFNSNVPVQLSRVEQNESNNAPDEPTLRIFYTSVKRVKQHVGKDGEASPIEPMPVDS